MHTTQFQQVFNKSSTALQKTGRSPGARLVTRFPSTTTGESSYKALNNTHGKYYKML